MSSGIPSPPLSPHGSPSSFTSDFPSLSGSLYSFLAPDSPHLDYDSGPGGGDEDHALGFSSHEHPDSGLDLILPSLTLAGDTGHPDAYRRSLSRLHQTQTQPVTPYDLGKVNILVVGKHGAGKSLVCESLIGGAPHVLEARPWSDVQEDGSRSLQAATTERGRMNVTVTRANGWDDTDDAQPILDSAIRIAHQPFHQTSELFNDSETSSSEALSLSIDLLSSPATSLYTAAVVVLSASPTLIETQLLQTLSQHVPTIPFSPHRPRRRPHSPASEYSHPYDSRPQSRLNARSEVPSQAHSRFHSRRASPHRLRTTLAAHSRAPSVPAHLEKLAEVNTTAECFHPTSHRALREWIYDPRNLHKLRRDAAQRFLAWRKRERDVDSPLSGPGSMGSSRTGLDWEHRLPAKVEEDDPFSTFTFDQLLNSSDSDDEEKRRVGETTTNPPLRREDRSVPAWQADLLSALKRRPGSDERMGTYRAASGTQGLDVPTLRIRLANTTAPISPQSQPFEDGFETTLSSFSCSEDVGSVSSGSVMIPAPFGIDPGNRIDPFHLPSFLSLALSIIPDLRSRILARIREAFDSSREESDCLEAGTFSTNDEKGYRTLHSPKMRATEPRVKGRSGMVPTAVMVVVAAALGFWAGVVVGGGSTGQVGDGHGSSGSGLMILQQLAKVRDLL
ncbi:hypothetical protein FRB94_006093 [Tulasnella sp. JGI-2019a]|nr:hypothetical protein FRB93_013246 [Tulasnella sp. JGI-2019a]KAG8999581.1 hypothetical protein FRB94_006093 [Tulasnella sp. JGI-2019a]